MEKAAWDIFKKSPIHYYDIAMSNEDHVLVHALALLCPRVFHDRRTFLTGRNARVAQGDNNTNYLGSPPPQQQAFPQPQPQVILLTPQALLAALAPASSGGAAPAWSMPPPASDANLASFLSSNAPPVAGIMSPMPFAGLAQSVAPNGGGISTPLAAAPKKAPFSAPAKPKIVVVSKSEANLLPHSQINLLLFKVKTLEAVVAEKDKELAGHMKDSAAKNKTIATLSEAPDDTKPDAKDKKLAERGEQLAEKDKELAGKDQLIAALTEELLVANVERQMHGDAKEVIRRGVRITELGNELVSVKKARDDLFNQQMSDNLKMETLEEKLRKVKQERDDLLNDKVTYILAHAQQARDDA